MSFPRRRESTSQDHGKSPAKNWIRSFAEVTNYFRTLAGFSLDLQFWRAIEGSLYSECRGVRPSEPTEAQREHTGVESVIGGSNSGVRHVHVAVLHHDGPLRRNEMLNTEAALRRELKVAAQLRGTIGQGGLLHPAAQIQKRNVPPVRLPLKSEEDRVAQQAAPGMDGISKNTFIHQFKPLHKGSIAPSLAGDQGDLRLGHQQSDMRNVPGYGVLKGESDLPA
jgi:hypothetical protein